MVLRRPNELQGPTLASNNNIKMTTSAQHPIMCLILHSCNYIYLMQIHLPNIGHTILAHRKCQFRALTAHKKCKKKTKFKKQILLEGLVPIVLVVNSLFSYHMAGVSTGA